MNSRAEQPGCVILLIDESSAMESILPITPDSATRSEKTKAESCATAINSFLNRLINGPNVDLALVGYRSDDDRADVGSRWGGPLEGRDFVPTSDLANSTVRIEERIRKRPPGSGGQDAAVQFPIWYEPSLNGQAPQVAAFNYCADLLQTWLTSASNPAPPVICHVIAGSSADGNPQQAAERILELEGAAGSPLFCHVFLSSHEQITPNAYASNRTFLPSGAARAIYDRSSQLPDELIREFRKQGLVVNDRARAMLHNATMVDLVRCLTVLQHHIESWSTLAAPGAAAAPADAPAAVASGTGTSAVERSPDVPEESSADANDLNEDTVVGVSLSEPDLDFPRASPEQPAAVVLVLDRSLEDPYGSQMNNVCRQLCAEANKTLAEIADQGEGSIEVAVISYGLQDGTTEIRNAFGETSDGPIFLRDTQLSEHTIRVDEEIVSEDDGTGGILERPVKKRIFLEEEASETGSIVDAFSHVAGMLEQWRNEFPAGPRPIVLHLTRGQFNPDEIRQASAALSRVDGVCLYHVVKPEYGHPAGYYPADDSRIENDNLKAVFEVTSPLLGAARMVEEDSLISADSRGMVINGPFTKLLTTIQPAKP
jgi:hypothetical protein